MKECNHILGQYTDNLTSEELFAYNSITRSELSNFNKSDMYAFEFCPLCGCSVSGILENKIDLHRKELEAEKIRKEKEVLKKDTDAESKLKEFRDVLGNDEFKIVIKRNNDKNIIYWTLDQVKRDIIRGELSDFTLEAYELVNPETVISKLLDAGYVKTDKSFWYDFRKGNRGVTVDGNSIYTGLFHDDDSLSNVSDFYDRKQCYTCSVDTVKEVLNIDIKLERII